MESILELKGISKAYGNVAANDNINLSLAKGEVHAILGENGAGKSTLMNILYGAVKADSGSIEIEGTTVAINSPRDAIANRIGMVHQHFMLIESMTVMENIVLAINSSEPGITVNEKQIAGKVKALSSKYGLEVPINAFVRDITVGQQQRVEIIKALYKNCSILILDEPTAALTPIEVKQLIKAVRLFKEEGKSVLFISHKLKEIMEISDRVTVLRGGKAIGTVMTQDTTIEELVYMMVGRKLTPLREGKETYGEALLKIKNLKIKDKRGITAVDNVSFTIRAGEVYGLAGVDGNGQNHIVKAVAGLIKGETGEIVLNNTNITYFTPRKVIESGVSHIPQDRQTEGLVLDLNMEENFILDKYNSRAIKKNHFMLSWPKIEDMSARLIEKYKIKVPSSKAKVSSLSGGNQQKVIIARALERKPLLLLAVHPTRGVDVGAIEFIHQSIIEAKENGCAVLLFSADLDEVLSLSDRIGVMYSGELIKEFSKESFDVDEIARAMIGSI